MIQETLEEAAKRYANDWEEIHPELDSEDIAPIEVSKIDFIAGAKWQQERMYSEEEVKQFAFECVANFLSNDDNKVEIKLVDVIIDRVNNKFEKFKK
jgi:hypothetical protein